MAGDCISSNCVCTRYAVAQCLEHDTTMFNCCRKHLHFFHGNIGRRLYLNLALQLLESDGNISINRQGATSVKFRSPADLKAHDWNFEAIRNNAHRDWECHDSHRSRDGYQRTMMRHTPLPAPLWHERDLRIHSLRFWRCRLCGPRRALFDSAPARGPGVA